MRSLVGVDEHAGPTSPAKGGSAALLPSPVIVFAIYAAIVWWQVAKHRRTLAGFVIAFVGAGFAAGFTWVLGVLLQSIASSQIDAGRAVTIKPYQLAPLWILMWAEVIIVGSVGLFIASLPRRPAGVHCRHCWYETHGLPAAPGGAVCPECGRMLA